MLTFLDKLSWFLVNSPANKVFIPAVYRTRNYIFFVTDCNFVDPVKFILFFKVIELS